MGNLPYLFILNNVTNTFLPPPFSNMAVKSFVWQYILWQYTLFMMHFHIAHVIKTFYMWLFFHKSYGFDAALRRSLKLRYFSPTVFPIVLKLPVSKIINLLDIQYLQFTPIKFTPQVRAKIAWGVYETGIILPWQLICHTIFRMTFSIYLNKF